MDYSLSLSRNSLTLRVILSSFFFLPLLFSTGGVQEEGVGTQTRKETQAEGRGVRVQARVKTDSTG